MYPSVPVIWPARRTLGAGHGKGAIEHVRRVDKGIAVHDTVAEELGVLQARHHMEDALLLAKGQVGLEAHQVIGGLLLVLGAQLNRRPGAAYRCAGR